MVPNAFADPIGHDVGQTGDTGAKPNPNNHNGCWEIGTNADITTPATNSLATTANNSDLNGGFQGACGTFITQDVRIYVIDLPNGFGSAPCVSPGGPGPGVECNRYDLAIDRVEILAATPDAFDGVGLAKTICHELGHSMGLTHYKDGNNDFPNAPDGQSDCMISGVVPNGEGYWTIYSNHHKAHINWEF